MKFSEKLKWVIYYFSKYPKGRFEIVHILQLFMILIICILIAEVVLYICLNG
jgi:hypothetical protein